MEARNLDAGLGKVVRQRLGAGFVDEGRLRRNEEPTVRQHSQAGRRERRRRRNRSRRPQNGRDQNWDRKRLHPNDVDRILRVVIDKSAVERRRIAAIADRQQNRAVIGRRDRGDRAGRPAQQTDGHRIDRREIDGYRQRLASGLIIRFRVRPQQDQRAVRGEGLLELVKRAHRQNHRRLRRAGTAEGGQIILIGGADEVALNHVEAAAWPWR